MAPVFQGLGPNFILDMISEAQVLQLRCFTTCPTRDRRSVPGLAEQEASRDPDPGRLEPKTGLLTRQLSLYCSSAIMALLQPLWDPHETTEIEASHNLDPRPSVLGMPEAMGFDRIRKSYIPRTIYHIPRNIPCTIYQIQCTTYHLP